MGDLGSVLAGVDDDYLAGISNKGILKRAYKEKAENPGGVVLPDDLGADEPEIKVTEETVHIRVPLAESSCTCPSRSVCKHIVWAVLALKEAVSAAPAEQSITPGTITPETITHETVASEAIASLDKEIRDFPVEQCKKVLGAKGLRALLNQMELAKEQPESAADIRKSSVCLVALPDTAITVKLLSPLEYSTCSCHKKELCSHKAAAILWAKRSLGSLDTDALKAAPEEGKDAKSLDLKRVHEAAVQMRAYLEELFCTGLSRTAPEVTDGLERLAVVAHNAELPDYEGLFRSLADGYGKYLRRLASFSVSELLQSAAYAYSRVCMLLDCEDAARLSELAGEFRAEYLSVGTLHLSGIAQEHFVTGNGYEGNRIYFLEEQKKKWYTYTDARPLFYEGGHRRPPGKAQTPWELPVAFDQLAKLRLELQSAKCDRARRISSTKETNAAVLDMRELSEELIGEWFYTDFGKLLEKVIEPDGSVNQTDAVHETRLFFVQAHHLKKAVFSETSQQLKLSLYDAWERELVVQLTYGKETAEDIRYLEKLPEQSPPCFLGEIRLSDGRLRMHPVAVFNLKWFKAQSLPASEENDAENRGEACKEPIEIYKEMEGFLSEIGHLLEDVFSSGFDTVYDGTLQTMEKAAARASQWGMDYLGEQLGKLVAGLKQRRHEEGTAVEELARACSLIREYLYLAKKKCAYDEARAYYKNSLGTGIGGMNYVS